MSLTQILTFENERFFRQFLFAPSASAWWPRGSHTTVQKYRNRKIWQILSNLLQLKVKVVEKLLKEFEKNVFSTRDLGRNFMDNYLKKVKYFIIFLRIRDKFFEIAQNFGHFISFSNKFWMSV